MNSSNNSVLVIGTGTIGEPLIGLLARLKNEFAIDEVLFHKRTPLDYEIAKVNSLVDQGATLVVDEDKADLFRFYKHKPSMTFREALIRAKVIIDCTPAGNENKDQHYLGIDAYTKDKTFIAQGSEKGFGVPYAHGINESVLTKADNPRFIQIVSCNTHAISRTIKALNPELDGKFSSGDFVCVRRSNDASQNDGFTPSPTCGVHPDREFGTHHARDVHDLLSTVTHNYGSLKSSAMKVNSQYMHVIRFSVNLNESDISLADVIDRFSKDKFVSITRHKTANKVFSFGRDHGFYGRIYNQAVVCLPSLLVTSTEEGTNVTGFMFTPQDGNSLLSSISACLYGLHHARYTKYLEHFHQFLKDEV